VSFDLGHTGPRKGARLRARVELRSDIVCFLFFAFSHTFLAVENPEFNVAISSHTFSATQVKLFKCTRDNPSFFHRLKGHTQNFKLSVYVSKRMKDIFNIPDTGGEI